MTNPLRTATYAVLVAGAFSCAESPHYVYTPSTANATAAGLPASRTPIPQERPQGAVEIASYGVTTLRPEPNAAEVAALHVRMIVTNDGDDTPWTLDTSQQLVEIPGYGQSRPLFVNSDVQTLPNITVARHERRMLDFYFPLPDAIRDDRRLPQFEMLWQVATPERVVASRTSFDRVNEAPAVAYDEPYWAGYPYWWYDPFYPAIVFSGVHPIFVRHHEHVVVGRFGGHFRPGGARITVRGHR